MRTLLTSFLLLALAATARATVIIPADLGELSRDAIAIVRGRVAAVDARWTEDRGTIETIVTLEVEGYLKGALGQVARFRVPGGELGRFRSIVVGAHGPTVPHVVGFNQGVYRLVRAADNAGWLVTPPANLPAAAGSVRIVRGDVNRRPLPLADFEQRVRALAGGAR
jgi:hypothetical protein